MEDNIKQLKQDYKKALKCANSKEEKIKIKTEYKSMKRMLDLSNKIIENDNKDMEKFDKVWDKLDKEYQKLGETPTFEEVKEELNDNQQQFEEQKKHSDEVIKKADEMIKQIDEKLAELEKKESLEKNKQDYIDWKNDVKNFFEKDSNGAYIRLIIPSEFVCLILPEYNNNMDLRGKKDLDLTTDEVIVLKKYAYELSKK